MYTFDLEGTGLGAMSFQLASWVTSIMVFHLYSVWLFTASDLKTIVGPSLLFGLANAAGASSYGIDLSMLPCPKKILLRTPLILLWIWMNLLPFTINNQKDPDAIREDTINKPWRTLPSGRMSSRQAKFLMVAVYPLAVCLSYLLVGGARQSLALVVLGTWYNNFAGADSSFFTKNFINALGYVSFTSGAMEVALGFPLPLKPKLLQWFCIIAAIIFTTIHLQDMPDQEGDSVKGRKTMPLVVGDKWARWTIASFMIFWGSTCPWLLHETSMTTALSLGLAGVVALRVLLRAVESDRLTFKLWNLWMTLIFILPLVG
ncbi:hypothetical protein EV356DRAFT_505635 [Viridothelium virens]|uniref:UbiA prenyltransferase n=1 Tax=Viridothelium virens TaxID=1048519 RepID=A0A6A6H3W8_VIRVR|nr:hypothetical protein EV356DRAFT_505635 [Viridothelium virens]